VPGPRRVAAAVGVVVAPADVAEAHLHRR